MKYITKVYLEDASESMIAIESKINEGEEEERSTVAQGKAFACQDIICLEGTTMEMKGLCLLWSAVQLLRRREASLG